MISVNLPTIAGGRRPNSSSNNSWAGVIGSGPVPEEEQNGRCGDRRRKSGSSGFS